MILTDQLRLMREPSETRQLVHHPLGLNPVIGELVASNRGLGYLINESASTLNTAGVFAALVTLTVIAAILNALVSVLGRWTDRWRPLEDDN